MSLPADSPILPDFGDRWWDTLSWRPDAHQQVQFQQLYTAILEGNRQLNLTRITEPVDFWEKHLWDSLRGIQPWLKPVDFPPSPGLTTIGFPGLPIAIAQPSWTVTLLDSTRKKIDFLNHLLPILGLSNVKTLIDRAEPVGQSSTYRETFDLAMVRAVATTSVCAEYALPLLKPGGVAVLYRGQWTAEEQAQLTQAADLLGGELEQVDQFKTPISNSDRTCVYLRKVGKTSAAYPRAIGLPSQKPLG
jgi:16S rRNA (guanine527-N7)-methyltransferase